ncbi:MAG: hypothetical protein ACFFBD_13265 [Candidatus Hodarchaeota archaeon]
MKFALDVPNSGNAYTNPQRVARLAKDTEEAGWDGFFIWDTITSKDPLYINDPLILLTAASMNTQTIKIVYKIKSKSSVVV